MLVMGILYYQNATSAVIAAIANADANIHAMIALCFHTTIV